MYLHCFIFDNLYDVIIEIIDSLLFTKMDINKLNSEYLSKYEQYLYMDINNHIVDKYNDIIEKIKEDSKELNNEINKNKENIDKYLTNLLNK